MSKSSNGKRKELSLEALELIAARFRALSEPNRLRLLHALFEGEMSVSQLVSETNCGQANVSKHLSMLLEAGLVARRKDGLNVYYRIADETVFELCEVVCEGLGVRLAAQTDAVKRFSRRGVSPRNLERSEVRK